MQKLQHCSTYYAIFPFKTAGTGKFIFPAFLKKKKHFSPDQPIYGDLVLNKLDQTVLDFTIFCRHTLTVFPLQNVKIFLQCS